MEEIGYKLHHIYRVEYGRIVPWRAGYAKCALAIFEQIRILGWKGLISHDMTDYRHEPTNTSIRDFGDGHIEIDLRYSPDRDVFLLQAQWFEATLAVIVRAAGKPLDLVFDLHHFEPSVWDAVMKEKCRQMVEESTIVRKIALIGDGLIYATVLITLQALENNKEKIKFFFNRNDAKDWLGW